MGLVVVKYIYVHLFIEKINARTSQIMIMMEALWKDTIKILCLDVMCLGVKNLKDNYHKKGPVPS